MSSHRISLSNFAKPPDAVGQKISHLETILSLLEQMIRILWILLYKQEREFSRRMDNSDISVGKIRLMFTGELKNRAARLMVIVSSVSLKTSQYCT